MDLICLAYLSIVALQMPTIKNGALMPVIYSVSTVSNYINTNK